MGTPISPVDDAFEQAMRRKRLQEELAQGVGGAPAPAPTPEATPAPAVAQPAADPLSTAKLKLSMGMTEDNLTPEEQAAIAAEQLVPAPAPAAPAPAAGEQGFMSKMLGMMGLGG